MAVIRSDLTPRCRALWVVAALTTALFGCATSRKLPPSGAHADRPMSRELPSAAPEPINPTAKSELPEASGTTAAEAPADPPVIVALLAESEASRSSGDLDDAVLSLERALRIQPRNARLWHALAKVRLQQGEAELAEELARKSSVLAAADSDLVAANRQLIAAARQRQGIDAADPGTEGE